MCMFSQPSPPELPADPVKEREEAAEAAEQEKKTRLAKRKGGREFLNTKSGFQGLQNTLLGASVGATNNQL